MWALLALLLLGGSLRFQGLSRRGLVAYDEGFFIQAAKGPAIAARWAVNSWIAGEPLEAGGLRAEFARQGFPYPSLCARPGHAGLMALGMSVAGIRDVVPLAISALLGTWSILWVYRSAFLLGGARAALLAAAFLACSPNHVFFSRSGLSHVTALFFLLWAFTRFLERGKGSFGAGLLAGAAFVCHYSLFWAVPLMALGEILALRGPRAFRGCAARILLMGLGWLVFPLLCEAATRLARYALGGWAPGFGTYFSEIQYGLGGLMRTVFARAQSTPWFYVIHVVRTEGAVFSGLLAGGITWGAWRMLKDRGAVSRGIGLSAIAVAVIFGFYSALDFRACRTLLPAFGFGAVLLGCFLDRVAARVPVAALLLLCVHAFVAAPRVAQAAQGVSPYPALADAARRDGRHLVAVDDFPVVDFYQGGNREVLIRDRAAFERLKVQGPLRLLVVNRGGMYGFEDPLWAAEGRYAFVEEVVRSRRPGDIRPLGFPLAFDYTDADLRWDRVRSVSDLLYRIEAYDLDDSH